jgi:hypothetical protein
MTHTKGNVIVENIKIGDVHYEFEYGMGIKCKVVTLPVRDENGYWHWQSENLNTGKIIDYGVTENLSHYAPNLYDYEAYEVKTWI